MNKVVIVSRFNRVWVLIGLLLFNFAVGDATSYGQDGLQEDTAPANAQIIVAPDPNKLTDEQIANGPQAAHNAWMLVCCALVLFMTAPG